MKITIVGDIHVDVNYFEEQVKRIPEFIQATITKLSWNIGSKDKFQEIARNIEKNGPENIPYPEGFYEELVASDVIFTHFFPINDSVISQNKNLKLIATCRGGVEHISKTALKKQIKVVNTIRNAEPVADFTIGLIYAETRNIARSHKKLVDGFWKKNYSNSRFTSNLNDYTVGVVGFGNIGQLVAKKLVLLGVEVLVADKFMSAEQIKAINPTVKVMSVEDLHKNADIITYHIRYDESEGPLLNKNTIESLKENAVIINTSRGYLVNYDDLYVALRDKRIAGAALDVFPDEPLFGKWDQYLTLDNVTLTPHIAGDTVSAIPLSPKTLVNNLLESKIIENIFH